jgi:LacI family transcriptional regulator
MGGPSAAIVLQELAELGVERVEVVCMPSNNVTMKHVAKLADVSVQTVSAVINGKPGISKETTDRVRNAIDQLGYRPFSVARSLRTGSTRTIAMVISDIANPSFSTMASAVEDIAHAMGYTIVVYNTHEDFEREASYIRMATERWVDGMLVVPTRDHSESIAPLQKAGIPFVVLDRSLDGYRGPNVTLNHYRAGQMAAEHLLELGHRNFAHISVPLRLKLARDRQDGFCAVLNAQGIRNIPVSESGGWTCQDGYQAMKILLSRIAPPSALFCASDRVAIGAMLALSEQGLSVPKDVSVVGLDDIEVAAYQIPPLTTIRQPFAEIGTRGVRLLIDMIHQREALQTEVLIEPELVVRQSTARVG